MKRIMAVLCLLTLGANALADGSIEQRFARCDRNTARLVEERLATVSSWREFAAFYRQYAVCDRSALTYAFTERIAALSMDEGNILDLQSEIARAPFLRRVVLKHLRSESITADQSEQIRDAVGPKCPSVAKRLCREILTAIE